MNTVCCRAKLLRVIKFWKNEARVMIDAIERVIACDLRDSIKSMVYKRKSTRITRKQKKNHTSGWRVCDVIPLKGSHTSHHTRHEKGQMR